MTDPDPELGSLALKLVANIQKRLPEDIRVLAQKVPVICEDFPSEETVREGLDPDLLGLFVGASHGEEANQDTPLPPQIIIYIGSIWDYVEGDLPAFRKEVKVTYLHELGHFLGWDEDEVAERGLD
jgi:predicted Zn-dependent protease with MMP-like domain